MPDANFVILWANDLFPIGGMAPAGAETVCALSPFLLNGLSITASQINPAGQSAQSSPPIVVSPPPPPPAPTVHGPIFDMDPCAIVTDVEPDATFVVVLVNDLPAGGAIATGDPSVCVPSPYLLVGLEATVIQFGPTGRSAASSPGVLIQPKFVPRAPWLPRPIFAGENAVRVESVASNASLVIIYINGHAAAFTDPKLADIVEVPISPRYLRAGVKVTATQTTPGGESLPSAPVIVQPAP